MPFFTGGATISLAISRLSANINAVYAADLLGAGAGCLLLMPALNILGAPGAIVASARHGRPSQVSSMAGVPAASASPWRARWSLIARTLRPCASFRRQHDQGTREPPGPLQQVELVLADRRLRAAVRRVVAQHATRVRCPTPA